MFTENAIAVGDCLTILPTVPDASVQLAVADPPWNIRFSYDQYKDDLPRHMYAEWSARWINAVVPKLTADGALWVMIADESCAAVKTALDDSGLHFRNWVIWHYTFGTYCHKKFGRCHAHLLYYTKSPSGFFWEPDRIPSARQEKYDDSRADPRGKIPGDVWEYSRVAGTFGERTDHPCQLPVVMLDRIVRTCSSPGGLVIDPFAGSGTTLVS
ncbi:MAG: DNA-methyltransferase, partial [Fimbriiglobus sp.]